MQLPQLGYTHSKVIVQGNGHQALHSCRAAEQTSLVQKFAFRTMSPAGRSTVSAGASVRAWGDCSVARKAALSDVAPAMLEQDSKALPGDARGNKTATTRNRTSLALLITTDPFLEVRRRSLASS